MPINAEPMDEMKRDLEKKKKDELTNKQQAILELIQDGRVEEVNLEREAERKIEEGLKQLDEYKAKN